MRALVAGAGRLGVQIADALTGNGYELTIVERDDARIAELAGRTAGTWSPATPANRYAAGSADDVDRPATTATPTRAKPAATPTTPLAHRCCRAVTAPAARAEWAGSPTAEGEAKGKAAPGNAPLRFACDPPCFSRPPPGVVRDCQTVQRLAVC
ncbi:hypothetical protein RB614_03985 [Phytohabitans sp. ZYX-F-186]|uniref:RCK N-terminal domain-containing protein n=1 Tax=Phytohabitans maris TaxID=3071409 RepID=A0ABU0Z9F0_9ACTN|nr:hypothetical protein [Phytohabitans sp. ZYX-F-186]MDQ7903675.1 hypothetical protein [Phytohabitans sp. ZYX-F-186]